MVNKRKVTKQGIGTNRDKNGNNDDEDNDSDEDEDKVVDKRRAANKQGTR